MGEMPKEQKISGLAAKHQWTQNWRGKCQTSETFRIILAELRTMVRMQKDCAWYEAEFEEGRV